MTTFRASSQALDAATLDGEFFKKFRNRRSNAPSAVGLELEFPVVDRNTGYPPRHLMEEFFLKLPLSEKRLIVDHLCYGSIVGIEAQLPNPGSASDRIKKSTITISLESGHGVLEIALPPFPTLVEAYQQLHAILDICADTLIQSDLVMLCYGVHPFAFPNDDFITRSQRFLTPLEESPTRFLQNNNDFSLFTLTASSQVHIDCSLEEVVGRYNVFNALSGPMIYLFANSQIWRGRIDPDCKAVREQIWEFGMSHRKSQIGMAPRAEDRFDILKSVINKPVRCFQRDTTICFVPENMSFTEFLQRAEVETRIYGGATSRIRPQLTDVIDQSSFCWFNARAAPGTGTVEIRPCCQQPQSGLLTVGAFVLGITSAFDDALELVSHRRWEEWHQIRKQALGASTEQDVEFLRDVCSKLLLLAYKGLRRRDFGEECFLDPLAARFEKGQCPADEGTELFLRGGPEAFRHHYAYKRGQT
jgi:gamma-glutamylcysteine synthetase